MECTRGGIPERGGPGELLRRRVTQAAARSERTKPDCIGLGSYNIDSQAIQRLASPLGASINEGFLNVRTAGPLELPYRSIVPRAGECDNLLVPVCASVSHVAYSAIRLEPQYTILGHTAGVAASLAARANTSVQKVPLPELQRCLATQKQILKFDRRISAPAQ